MLVASNTTVSRQAQDGVANITEQESTYVYERTTESYIGLGIAVVILLFCVYKMFRQGR